MTKPAPFTLRQQRLADWYLALPPRARHYLRLLLAWRLQRVREERGTPFLSPAQDWQIIHHRGWRLTHATLGSFALTRTWSGPLTRDITDYWPAEVRRAIQDDLHRVAHSQDLARFRWHWDKWSRRGFVTRVDDVRLLELMRLAALDQQRYPLLRHQPTTTTTPAAAP